VVDLTFWYFRAQLAGPYDRDEDAMLGASLAFQDRARKRPLEGAKLSPPEKTDAKRWLIK